MPTHLQNPSKIPLVLPRLNQKKIKKRIRVKDSVASDNPWAFFDLSSVAAGLQSAMQQYYLPTIYIIGSWRVDEIQVDEEMDRQIDEEMGWRVDEEKGLAGKHEPVLLWIRIEVLE